MELSVWLLDAISKWLENPIAAVLQLSALLAVYVSTNNWFQAQKRRKIPSFAFRTIPMWWKGGYEGNRGGAGDGLPVEPPVSRVLLDSLRRGIRAVFPEQDAEQVVLTRVAFWNGGVEAIRAQDIVADNPLRLEAAPSGKILSAWVVDRTGHENHFDWNAGTTSIQLVFDYADYKDGMVLTVIHTGDMLRAEGKIIGVRNIRQERHKGEGCRTSIWIMLGLIWSSMLAAFFVDSWIFERSDVDPGDMLPGFLMLLGFCWAPALSRLLSPRVPFRLESFEDDTLESWDLPAASW
jgi:hypothetical protein